MIFGSFWSCRSRGSRRSTSQTWPTRWTSRSGGPCWRETPRTMNGSSPSLLETLTTLATFRSRWLRRRWSSAASSSFPTRQTIPGPLLLGRTRRESSILCPFYFQATSRLLQTNQGIPNRSIQLITRCLCYGPYNACDKDRLWSRWWTETAPAHRALKGFSHINGYFKHQDFENLRYLWLFKARSYFSSIERLCKERKRTRALVRAK